MPIAGLPEYFICNLAIQVYMSIYMSICVYLVYLVPEYFVSDLAEVVYIHLAGLWWYGCGHVVAVLSGGVGDVEARGVQGHGGQLADHVRLEGGVQLVLAADGRVQRSSYNWIIYTFVILLNKS